MNKLTKLTINKFRNVQPTTLEFRPGINVVLGKNAAGKTTLLRLLSTLIGTNDDALQEDELDVSCRASGAGLDFEHVLIKRRIEEPIPSFDPSQRVRGMDFVLQRSDSFVFKREGEVVLRLNVLPNAVLIKLGQNGGQVRLRREGADGSLVYDLAYALSRRRKFSFVEDPWPSVFLALYPGAGRMDESLEGLDRLLKIELRKEESGGFAQSLKRSPNAILFMNHKDLLRSTPESSITFSLEFLDSAARILGYDSANARFDVEHLGSELGQKLAQFGNLRFFFKRQDEEVSHRLLSYGQKRLLAFFAHAASSGGVIIADELVNGLHHEWISACLDAVGGNQSFLTSQNPLLLDFLRFDSADEVRRAFILCERINGDAGAQLVWRNPTEDEADSFFSAYQTGIQRVSDILLTKGLW